MSYSKTREERVDLINYDLRRARKELAGVADRLTVVENRLRKVLAAEDRQAQQRMADVLDAALVRFAGGTWNATEVIDHVANLVSDIRAEVGK